MDKFNLTVAQFCENIDGAVVYTPKAIINQYQFGGKEEKLAKRKLLPGIQRRTA